jgi:hypothetical protein
MFTPDNMPAQLRFHRRGDAVFRQGKQRGFKLGIKQTATDPAQQPTF